MRKRIFSIGISAVMIGSLLLTACGGKSSGGSSSSAGETGEAGTAAVGESTAAEAGDPFGKYDPPVKMTSGRDD